MSKADEKAVQKNMQIMRYSDEELMLLNETFAERVDLLKIFRKFMLQGKLTDSEKESIKFFTAPNLYMIISKTYLPVIDLETPIGQLVDLWSNINTKEKGVEDAWLEMASRAKVIAYVSGRLDDLINQTDIGPRVIDLEYSPEKSKEENFIDLAARNTIVNHVDFQTGQLWILAGNKKETMEEITKRLFANSNK